MLIYGISDGGSTPFPGTKESSAVGSAPGLGPGGREFESHLSYKIITKSGVTGSTYDFGSYSQGSTPCSSTIKYVAVVQLVERQVVVLDVVGSSPTGHPKSK